MWIHTMYAHFFFFNDTATTEIYTLSLHDALPIFRRGRADARGRPRGREAGQAAALERQADGGEPPRRRSQRTQDGRVRPLRSEEHTSELQSRQYLVCRLLLEKQKNLYDGTTNYEL